MKMLVLFVVAVALQFAAAVPHSAKFERIPYEMEDDAMDSNAAEIYSSEQDALDIQSSISVTRCGVPGNIVNTVLQASLGWLLAIYPRAVNVLVQCGTCTHVRVEAPVGTVQADVNVCIRNNQVCVQVQAAPRCQPGFLATPITLNIPVQTKTVRTLLRLDLLGANPCVSVQFNAPVCSNQG